MSGSRTELVSVPHLVERHVTLGEVAEVADISGFADDLHICLVSELDCLIVF